MRKHSKREIWLPFGKQIAVRIQPPSEGYPYWRRHEWSLSDWDSFVLYSNEMVSMAHHWSGGNTSPCVAHLGIECDYCRPPEEGGRRSCWQGYFVGVAADERRKDFAILTVTPGAVAKNPALKDRADLAGFVLSGHRSGGHIRGAVQTRLSLSRRKEIPSSKIIRPRLLQAVIFNIWGVSVRYNPEQLLQGVEE